MRELVGPTLPILQIGFIPGPASRLAAVNRDAVYLWSLDRGHSVDLAWAPSAHATKRMLVASREGRWLVAGPIDQPCLWDISESPPSPRRFTFAGLLAGVFAGDPGFLTGVTRCAAGGGDVAFEFQVTRLETPDRQVDPAEATETRVPIANELAARLAAHDLSHWQGPDYWLLWAVLSDDGRKLAVSARERAVHLWDVGSNAPPRTITLRALPRGLYISQDGTRLAIDGGTSLYIFHLETHELLVKWRVRNAHEVFGSHVAWSPDGRLLARTNGSTTVRVYESTTGRELFAIGKKPGILNCVAFSPDGLTLATGTLDGPVRVWDVE